MLMQEIPPAGDLLLVQGHDELKVYPGFFELFRRNGRVSYCCID